MLYIDEQLDHLFFKIKKSITRNTKGSIVDRYNWTDKVN